MSAKQADHDSEDVTSAVGKTADGGAMQIFWREKGRREMMNVETVADGAQKSMPTDIRNARAMKRMGLPLNTPVETRTFDTSVSKHWKTLAKAENGFDSALVEYTRGPRAGSVGKFNLMKRRNDALYKAAADAWKFVEHYDDDPLQWQLLATLIQRALAVVEWWDEALAAAEEEGGVDSDLADAPRVFPAAT